MIKKTIISLVFLILLIGGGFFLYFDSIVKSGIEVVGSQVLGANVTLILFLYRHSAVPAA
jgi:hypothetical protein